MILGVLETLLGLLLLNISIKSLKKSVIRKWREGFVITLATSIIIIIHGLLQVASSPSEIFNTVLLFIVSSSLTLAFLRISKMKGLTS